MKKLYKIGDKIINLNELVAVGEVTNAVSGRLKLPLVFNFNSNVEAFFSAGESGAPRYHNSEGDWTEEDSDFWRYAETKKEELIHEWEKDE